MLEIRQLQKHILALEDVDETSKREALQSLRDHNEQEWATVPDPVIHALVKSLKDQLVSAMKQPMVQKEIALILGNVGPRSKTALPQLIELLHQGVPDHVREVAVTAIGRIGDESKLSVGPLVQLLSIARPALSIQTIRALGNLGCADERVRSALLDLWLSPLQHQNGKAQVAIALCKLHIPSQNVIGTLTKTLVTSQETSLRRAAAEALGWCSKSDAEVVPALLTASLSDKNEEIRQMAQAGLDRMGLSHEKAAQLCSRQLGTSIYAEVALRKSGQVAVAYLIKALGSEDPAIQLKAAHILGSIGEEAAGAASALASALHDGPLDVRLAAAQGLWNITKTADLVVPALVDLLEVKEIADLEADETRRMFVQTIMEALSRIGPPAKAAVSAITAWAKDKNRHIREAAITALQSIAPTVASRPELRR